MFQCFNVSIRNDQFWCEDKIYYDVTGVNHRLLSGPDAERSDLCSSSDAERSGLCSSSGNNSKSSNKNIIISNCMVSLRNVQQFTAPSIYQNISISDTDMEYKHDVIGRRSFLAHDNSTLSHSWRKHCSLFWVLKDNKWWLAASTFSGQNFRGITTDFHQPSVTTHPSSDPSLPITSHNHTPADITTHHH